MKWLGLLLLVCVCTYNRIKASRMVLVPWTIDSVDTISPLQIYQGDFLNFQCQNGSFSNVFQMTNVTQYNRCNAMDYGDQEPVIIGFCLGTPENHSIEITQNVEQLPGDKLEFEPGQMYYFASFSKGTALSDSLNSTPVGGECLRGLKLSISVLSGSAPTVPTGLATTIGNNGGNSGGLTEPLGQTEIIIIAVVISVAISLIVVIIIVLFCAYCCCKRNRSFKIESFESAQSNTAADKEKLKKDISSSNEPAENDKKINKQDFNKPKQKNRIPSNPNTPDSGRADPNTKSGLSKTPTEKIKHSPKISTDKDTRATKVAPRSAINKKEAGSNKGSDATHSQLQTDRQPSSTENRANSTAMGRRPSSTGRVQARRPPPAKPDQLSQVNGQRSQRKPAPKPPVGRGRANGKLSSASTGTNVSTGVDINVTKQSVGFQR